MKMPESQQEVEAELVRVNAEREKLKGQMKWLDSQIKALQNMCSHPSWRHDNDPRGSSSMCTVCGHYT